MAETSVPVYTMYDLVSGSDRSTYPDFNIK